MTPLTTVVLVKIPDLWAVATIGADPAIAAFPLTFVDLSVSGCCLGRVRQFHFCANYRCHVCYLPFCSLRVAMFPLVGLNTALRHRETICLYHFCYKRVSGDGTQGRVTRLDLLDTEARGL